MNTSPAQNSPAVPGAAVFAATVLIVDDLPMGARLVELTLQRAGYGHLYRTSDPCAVLQLCETVRPDLVLLDLRMPELDGFAVMAQLQARALQPPPRILVLTASGEKEQVRALQAGASDVLQKPFERRVLLERVQTLLTMVERGAVARRAARPMWEHS